MKVLKLLLSQQTNNTKQKVAYIAQKIRNPQTFSFFIEHLEKEEICYRKNTTTSIEDIPQLFDYSREGLVLYELSMSNTARVE